ncbi:hypothetical protein VNO77_36855 [Canavalia gladiata]|uniref:B box-type domain-containing protein n=1 Tax=Canavalia gladiata TaxID=3824 RepID=A0AAN9PWT9_CANGL
MKKCELCKVPARIFCESDQASLCWDCDDKVHGANFLVARHSRTLLCHSCLSPTPWKASGAKLGNAVSVCERCAAGNNGEEEAEESEEGNDEEIDTEDDDVDDGGDVTGDEDGDNQVVPWSSTPPPPAASSSSSEWSSFSRCKNDDDDENNGNGYVDGGVSVSEPPTTTVSLKRQREDEASDRDRQEGWNGCASQRRCGGEWKEEVACGGEPPSKE